MRGWQAMLCYAVQVRNVALTCTADLLKAPQAHHEALATPGFASHLLQALRVSTGCFHSRGCAASKLAPCLAESRASQQMDLRLLLSLRRRARGGRGWMTGRRRRRRRPGAPRSWPATPRRTPPSSTRGWPSRSPPRRRAW